MNLKGAPLPEIQELFSWLGNPPRSPQQTHLINESDSEILDLGNGTYLATTIDTISAEIEVGLYKDPYTMGWVVAMASLSDLAAVGANPLGTLLSTEWNSLFSVEKKAEFSRGYLAALHQCKTYLLGGDSGACRSNVISGVAIGLCQSKPMSRIGIKDGDWICVTGQTGLGPALAIRFLQGQPETSFPESLYRPVARIEAGIALRPFASACMDTSDGILSTLHTLRSLNGIEFEFFWNQESLSPIATEYLDSLKLPHFLLWANEHGDYQLIAAIPDQHIALAEKCVPDLYRIGRVTTGNKSLLKTSDSREISIDLEFIKSLINSNQSDLRNALHQIIDYSRTLQLP